MHNFLGILIGLYSAKGASWNQQEHLWGCWITTTPYTDEKTDALRDSSSLFLRQNGQFEFRTINRSAKDNNDSCSGWLGQGTWMLSTDSVLTLNLQKGGDLCRAKLHAVDLWDRWQWKLRFWTRFGFESCPWPNCNSELQLQWQSATCAN